MAMVSLRPAGCGGSTLRDVLAERAEMFGDEVFCGALGSEDWLEEACNQM
jgi:hypothetical protein